MSADPIVGSEDIERILARAAELDGGSPISDYASRVRAIATEAGISAFAVEEAMQEFQASSLRASPTLVSHEGLAMPWTIRLCLRGVPDRRTAMGYYRFWFGAMCVAPPLIAYVTYSAGKQIAGLVLSIAFALFCFANVWGTFRAVRWLDRHGLERVP